MYSPRVLRVSHIMNNQPSLNNLVKSVTNLVSKLNVTRPTGAKRRAKRRRSRANGLARNPGQRGDNSLSLTRSQFTATSPLNLFSITRGSTPGGVRVTGRELIAAVNIGVTTGAFTLSGNFDTATDLGAINPASFPRLAAYAPIYEYFIMHKITYLFQSNMPTTVQGAVVMAIDYDPTDPVPANTAGMMRNISSTMANIYSDATLEGLKSLSRLPRYQTDAPAAETLQSVQGTLYVAVEGFSVTAATAVGYIIAQYDVEFFTPQ